MFGLEGDIPKEVHYVIRQVEAKMDTIAGILLSSGILVYDIYVGYTKKHLRGYKLAKYVYLDIIGLLPKNISYLLTFSVSKAVTVINTIQYALKKLGYN